MRTGWLVALLMGCGAEKGGGAEDEAPWGIQDLAPGQSARGFLSVDGEVFTGLSAVAFYEDFDLYQPRVVIVDHTNASCDTPVICNSCSFEAGFFAWTRNPEEPYPTRPAHALSMTVHDADFDPETDRETDYLADTVDESRVYGGYIDWGEDEPEGVEWSSESEIFRSDDLEAKLDANSLPSYRGRIRGVGVGALSGYNEQENRLNSAEFEFDISFSAPLCN
jgi:hypothetical protein